MLYLGPTLLKYFLYNISLVFTILCVKRYLNLKRFPFNFFTEMAYNFSVLANLKTFSIISFR